MNLNTGLAGPTIVYNKGIMNQIISSLRNYAGNMSYWKPQLTNMPTVSLSTTQAPSFCTLNGWVLANSPPFEICTDDKVIWYAYAFGDASHVFHMHGNGFKSHGKNMVSKSLNDCNR